MLVPILVNFLLPLKLLLSRTFSLAMVLSLQVTMVTVPELPVALYLPQASSLPMVLFLQVTVSIMAVGFLKLASLHLAGPVPPAA
jgi:hypothetical protein